MRVINKLRDSPLFVIFYARARVRSSVTEQSFARALKKSSSGINARALSQLEKKDTPCNFLHTYILFNPARAEGMYGQREPKIHPISSQNSGLVDWEGFEPPTPAMPRQYSYQLNYQPFHQHMKRST